MVGQLLVIKKCESGKPIIHWIFSNDDDVSNISCNVIQRLTWRCNTHIFSWLAYCTVQSIYPYNSLLSFFLYLYPQYGGTARSSEMRSFHLLYSSITGWLVMLRIWTHQLHCLKTQVLKPGKFLSHYMALHSRRYLHNHSEENLKHSLKWTLETLKW